MPSSPSHDVLRYSLAIGDMTEVAQTARIVAQQEAEAQEANPLLRFHVRLVIDTGLVVTYGRPFTEGRGTGFPLRASVFVPAPHRRLHESLMSLRKKVYAHTDATAPDEVRRRILSFETQDDGTETTETRLPPLIGIEDLFELAQLADEIAARLRAARRSTELAR